jgi:hypothetical protein
MRIRSDAKFLILQIRWIRKTKQKVKKEQLISDDFSFKACYRSYTQRKMFPRNLHALFFIGLTPNCSDPELSGTPNLVSGINHFVSATLDVLNDCGLRQGCGSRSGGSVIYWPPGSGSAIRNYGSGSVILNYGSESLLPVLIKDSKKFQEKSSKFFNTILIIQFNNIFLMTTKMSR